MVKLSCEEVVSEGVKPVLRIAYVRRCVSDVSFAILYNTGTYERGRMMIQMSNKK